MIKPEPKYVNASYIRKQYCISMGRLKNWAEAGKIKFIRPEEGGRRLYHLQSVREAIGDKEETKDDTPVVKNQCIIYARVSSSQQQPDLDRQQKDLQDAFPHHDIITDVASGLNFKRKGLQALLDRVIKGVVKEVVVMHKDRLCRFGIDLLTFLFEKYGTKLVVYGKEVQSSYQELTDDLLAVTTVFVARNNGLRSAENRKRRRIEGEAESTISPKKGRKVEGEAPHND